MFNEYIYSRFFEMSANFVYLFWYYYFTKPSMCLNTSSPIFSQKLRETSPPTNYVEYVDLGSCDPLVFLLRPCWNSQRLLHQKRKCNSNSSPLKIGHPNGNSIFQPPISRGAMLVYQRVVPFALCSQHIPLMFFPHKTNKQTL